MQIVNVTLTAIVFAPDRIPQVAKASTTVTSGWVHGRGGTLALDASIGPEAAIQLAMTVAPQVAAALGCPIPQATSKKKP
jgi:hypothetical protein